MGLDLVCKINENFAGLLIEAENEANNGRVILLIT